mmetsp:Transcript_30717/g.70485  ORF Transcript_30717/g.70485 Transcript_30717/m.70485 type:complete len:170 (-) Transcript_30717:33-542(-)
MIGQVAPFPPGVESMRPQVVMAVCTMEAPPPGWSFWGPYVEPQPQRQMEQMMMLMPVDVVPSQFCNLSTAPCSAPIPTLCDAAASKGSSSSSSSSGSGVVEQVSSRRRRRGGRPHRPELPGDSLLACGDDMELNMSRERVIKALAQTGNLALERAAALSQSQESNRNSF